MVDFGIFICGALFGAGVAAVFAIRKLDKQDKFCKETTERIWHKANAHAEEAWRRLKRSDAERYKAETKNAQLYERLLKAQQILAGETEDE